MPAPESLENGGGTAQLSPQMIDNGKPTASKNVDGKKRASFDSPPAPVRRKMELSPLNGPRGKQAAAEKHANKPFLTKFCKYIVDHQISLPFNILAILGTAHLLSPVDSTVRKHTTKFLTVSYYNPNTGLYGKGIDDAYLVLFWVVAFTLLRAICMECIFIPFARHCGLKKKASIRFGEQGWSLLYYTVFWLLGMNILYNTKYFSNFTELWTDWPVRELDGIFKWYYCVQFACWIQQIFVLNIEERRKDHYQMFTHHIVTCSLMYGSYVFHLMRVGHMILCIMDVVDILLPAAKMLKYLGFSTLCDCTFGLFLLAWFFGRHVIFVMVVLSAQNDCPANITFGCYERTSTGEEQFSAKDESRSVVSMLFNPQDKVCYYKSTLGGFVILLWMLQGITLVWFCMIMKVVIKIVKGGGAEDVRSEDEEEEEIEGIVDDEMAAIDLKLKKSQEFAYASVEASGSNGNMRAGSPGAGNASGTRKRKDHNGQLPAVFRHGKFSASQYVSPQKLAESKIGCGGDD